MKRALIAFVSVGILAVTIGVQSANAQAYSPYGARRTYAAPPDSPQSRGSVRRGAPRGTAPFTNSDSPQATGGGSLGYNQNLWNW
jgi:hypothetical protein